MEIEMNLRELEDMSRDELLDKVEELELDLKEANADIEKLTAKLEEAADVMAESGRIHSTPHAKYQWIHS
jgi:hypothetical protein